MTAPPSLRSLQLTGGRAWVRRITMALLPSLAAVAAVGYMAPAHRVYRLYDEPVLRPLHSNFADGGPLPIVVLTAAACALWLLRKRGFGAGIAAAVISTTAALVALASVFLAHMFSRVDYAAGEWIFAVGELGLFGLGTLTFITEPLLYWLERRRVVQAAKPALPVARVLA